MSSSQESPKLKVDLGPAQETLLIPLLGRAEETRCEDGILRDEKAVEIVDRLDYDFSKWAGKGGLRGATARTLMFDREVQSFLTQHPGGTVVEVGCGLNTRFDRVDNGEVTWLDVDFPDVIALRRRFFADRPRCTMVEIPGGAQDPQWLDRVRATNGPCCFVSEAALIYAEKMDAKSALTQIAQAFPDSTLVLDTTSSAIVSRQASHELMKVLDQSSWFKWACEHPSEVAEWTGFELLRVQTFMDAPEEAKSRAPFPFGLLMKYLPFIARLMMKGYYISTLSGEGDNSIGQHVNSTEQS